MYLWSTTCEKLIRYKNAKSDHNMREARAGPPWVWLGSIPAANDVHQGKTLTVICCRLCCVTRLNAEPQRFSRTHASIPGFMSEVLLNARTAWLHMPTLQNMLPMFASNSWFPAAACIIFSSSSYSSCRYEQTTSFSTFLDWVKYDAARSHFCRSKKYSPMLLNMKSRIQSSSAPTRMILLTWNQSPIFIRIAKDRSTRFMLAKSSSALSKCWKNAETSARCWISSQIIYSGSTQHIKILIVGELTRESREKKYLKLSHKIYTVYISKICKRLFCNG